MPRALYYVYALGRHASWDQLVASGGVELQMALVFLLQATLDACDAYAARPEPRFEAPADPVYRLDLHAMLRDGWRCRLGAGPANGHVLLRPEDNPAASGAAPRFDFAAYVTAVRRSGSWSEPGPLTPVCERDLRSGPSSG